MKRLESVEPKARAGVEVVLGLSRPIGVDVTTKILGGLSRLGYTRVRIRAIDPD